MNGRTMIGDQGDERLPPLSTVVLLACQYAARPSVYPCAVSHPARGMFSAATGAPVAA